MTSPSPRTRPAWVIVLVLAGLSMIGPFTIDTIFPGFASMGRQFGVDSTAMQQVTTAYLVPFAIMSIFHGPLSDALGRRPVMLVGLIGYVVASVLCALAPTLGWLLVARGMQGFFAGAATVVSRAIVRDIYAGHQAQKVMGQVMMIFSIAPAIAPVIGGWLLLLGPWPGIFWFVAGYGLVMAVLTVVVLPETLPPEQRQPLRLGAGSGGEVVAVPATVAGDGVHLRGLHLLCDGGADHRRRPARARGAGLLDALRAAHHRHGARVLAHRATGRADGR
ncbi:MAG: MFS transporter [Brachybacterium sp.]|nr:MFS transporter [Brachybacterium sp.]